MVQKAFKITLIQPSYGSLSYTTILLKLQAFRWARIKRF